MAKVPTEYQLMTAPLWRTLKGDFTVDEEAMLAIAEAFAKEGNSLPIYLGHFEDEEDENKEASGGYFDVDVRDDGVWAVNVRWREDIAEQIAAGGWLFDSPEFFHSKEEPKRVLQVTADALVHNPASIRKRPITASKPPHTKGAVFCCASAGNQIIVPAEDGADHKPPNASTTARLIMSDAILKTLGVNDEAEAISTIVKMQTSKDDSDKAATAAAAEIEKASKAAEKADSDVASVMEAAGCEDRGKLIATVTHLREQASKASEAGEALAKIQAEKDEAEKAGLIESCRCSKETADFLSKQDITVVKDYAEMHKDAPAVPDGSQADRASAPASTTKLSDDVVESVKASCSKKGMTDEETAKYLKDFEAMQAKLGIK